MLTLHQDAITSYQTDIDFEKENFKLILTGNKSEYNNHKYNMEIKF